MILNLFAWSRSASKSLPPRREGRKVIARVFGLGLGAVVVMLGVGPTGLAGCKATGVGDPCTPEQEYDTNFNGFDPAEVNVESKSFQCQTRLCLVNHFQGRVSCQYGQDTTGNPPAGASGACTVPGDPTKPIEGNPADPKKAKAVAPQCADRTADKAVYCSCRCANIDGKTDDGANYCTCPDGFDCTQLVTSIGAGDTGLTGAYCIKSGTKYDRNNACAATCDPTTQKCPGPQGTK